MKKTNNNILKYISYAILIELGTALLAFLCFSSAYTQAYQGKGGMMQMYVAVYVIPFLPLLFLVKNFKKVEWRAISLILSFINFLIILYLN